MEAVTTGAQVERPAGWDNIDKLRYIGLIGGFVTFMTISYSAAWSLLVNPLITAFGTTAGVLAVIFSLYSFGKSLTRMVAGKVCDKVGIRKSLIICLACQFIGLGMCAVFHNVVMLSIGFVVFVNLQSSFGSMTSLANAGRLFPDKKGFTMAFVTMGQPVGGMMISPLTQHFIDQFGVFGQFGVMMVILIVIGAVGILLTIVPPKGYMPNGYSFEAVKPNAAKASTEKDFNLNTSFVQKDWKMMLKDPAFWLTFFTIGLGYMAAAVFTMQMAWVAEAVVGVTAQESAFLISSVLLASVLGKLLLGILGDKVGRLNLLPALVAVEMVALASVMFMGQNAGAAFTVVALLVCFCNGGLSAMTGPLTSDLFGSKNFSFNLSLVMWCITLSAIISPYIGSLAYNGATILFGVCAAFNLVAVVLALILRKMRKDNLEVVYKR